jgi:hypothetical protein
MFSVTAKAVSKILNPSNGIIVFRLKMPSPGSPLSPTPEHLQEKIKIKDILGAQTFYL